MNRHKTRRSKSKNRSNGLELVGPADIAHIYYIPRTNENIIGISRTTLRYGIDYVKKLTFPFGFVGQLLTQVSIFYSDHIERYPVGSEVVGYTKRGKTYILLSMIPWTGQTLHQYIDKLNRSTKKYHI